MANPPTHFRCQVHQYVATLDLYADHVNAYHDGMDVSVVMFSPDVKGDQALVTSTEVPGRIWPGAVETK